MSTSSTEGPRRSAPVLTNRATMLRCVVGVIVGAALSVAGHEARYTVLILLATLGLFAAGVGFVLRWRVTSTAGTRQIGVGLLLLALNQPVAVVVSVVLDDDLPGAATATRLGVVLVAAGVTLRAFPARGVPPIWRLTRRASALLA